MVAQGTRIGGMYVEFGADTSGFKRGLADVKTGLQDVAKEAEGAGEETSSSFANIATSAAKAGGIILAFGASVKAAFEYGKQGAIIQQTKDSFDGLLDAVGAAPDLLERLRAASFNTVDDMTLMSSTATLLAGSTGEFATNLANSTPQLLEIAKAANKLNPTLGDTAFLYDSISKGIKRGSPLILDNLGLTLKIGEANEAYATALGKTVQELTASEKTQAILNATLEAGAILIEQAGGSAESAVDSFVAVEVAVKNAADALKTSLAPAITNVAIGTERLINGPKEVGNALDDLNVSVALGTDSYEDYIVAASHMRQEIGFVGGFMANLTDEQYQQITSAERLRQDNVLLDMTYQYLKEHVPQATESVFAFGESVETAADQSDGASGAIVGVWDMAERQVRAAEQAVEDYYSAINTGIGSQIERQMEAIEFRLKGGGSLETIATDINNAMVSKKITEQQGLDLMQGAFAAAQLFEVEMGNQSYDDAAQNLSDSLGIPIDEAKQKLEEFGTAANAISEIKETLTIEIIATGRTDLLQYIEGGLSIGVNVGGGSSPSGTTKGGGTSKGTSVGFASGVTDFVVPPGYPNDSFIVGLTSGEKINVAPQNSGNSSSVTVAPVFNISGGNPQEIANEVMLRLNRVVRSTKRAGILTGA